MRFHLKKTVTWLLAVTCFLLFTFNYYNRHIWVFENNTNVTLPWGQNFDNPAEHKNVHRPLFTAVVIKTLRNVTIDASKVMPTSSFNPETELIWHDPRFNNTDRIVNQLRYKPKWLIEKEKNGEETVLKKILMFNGIGGWQVKRGQQTFIEQKCLVNTCEITDSKGDGDIDAVLFTHSPGRFPGRTPNQVWIHFMLESPYHTSGLSGYGGVMNWTATYRHDSDIVAPYEKFVRYDENIKTLPQNRSYAEGKTKKVAWFVSNCGARNTRKEYANELAKHIEVDIYGACGTKKCPRSNKQHCFNMLTKDYKFYLSFENSNCRDYITEKFFVNGLQHDVIPIVMGAAPEDYHRSAPPHSFIHVDDFESPEELARYLHKLDQNDDLYNEYFRWKGTGSFINTFFWCRICGMLHDKSRASHSYRDYERWWRGPDVCIGKDSWRKHPRTSSDVIDNYL